MIKKIKTNVRSNCYDYVLTSGAVSTPALYERVLKDLPDNSNILEVGIGNGLCIEYNADLIRNKKLNIHGIDIDDEYLDICNQRIHDFKLDKLVSCKLQDLLEMNEDTKYDYVFFMESFPVIPLDIMDSMVSKSKKMLKKDGEMIFVHNLYKNHKHKSSIEFKMIDYLKRRIKYIPFIWIDFGRLTTVHDFDLFLKKCEVKVTDSRVLMSEKFLDSKLAKFAYYLFYLFFWRPLKIDSMDQYVYRCKAK